MHYEGYEKIMDIIMFAMIEDINYTWSILTDISSYGIMNNTEMYYLIGVGLLFLLAIIGYVFALNQSPVKYTYRRSWVKEPDLYEVIK